MCSMCGRGRKKWEEEKIIINWVREWAQGVGGSAGVHHCDVAKHNKRRPPAWRRPVPLIESES